MRWNTKYNKGIESIIKEILTEKTLDLNVITGDGIPPFRKKDTNLLPAAQRLFRSFWNSQQNWEVRISHIVPATTCA